MKYPIVKVTTKDDLVLHGILFEAKNSDKIIINIHGSAGNFYEEDFIKNMSLDFPKKGFSFLSTNNRGNSVLTHTWQKSGSGLEKFEDCLLDINSWIEFCLDKGYSKIILQGHSVGTEKIVYYMNKGKYRNKIFGIILLAFSDSYGNAIKFMDRFRCGDKLFKEARKLVKENKGEQFLASTWYSHAGILPKSAESFLNQFSEDSELSKAFPFRKSKLKLFSKIKIPILAVISGNEKFTNSNVVKEGSEHTILPIKKAINLLKKENKNTETVIIKNTNHDFEGKEKELSKIITKFLKKLK